MNHNTNQMGMSRALRESKNRKIRKMLFVLKAQIHTEKFEMQTTDLLKSCLRVIDGRTDCDHAMGRKCMCYIIRSQADDDAPPYSPVSSSSSSSN